MSDNVIQIKELTKQFRTKFGTLTAVDKVSFDIRKGENFGLVGESGSGKSTIGSMLVGTYGPTAGSITFQGDIDISRSSKSREPALKKKYFNWCFRGSRRIPESPQDHPADPLRAY